VHTLANDYVHETRFGVWFLGTQTWTTHVLTRAIKDLERLVPQRRASYPVIVDVGCGWGQSFQLLAERFAPQKMIGIDASHEMLDLTAATTRKHGLAVELHRGDSSRLPLADESADLVFCHQTFHHLVHQHAALAEFRRVLKPGGLLLFAESTRAYIHSWMIRLLFRHPMDVQRTAAEYLAMVREGGFTVAPESISYPYLWWSRSDLGILERGFGIKPKPDHEETLINLVAVRR
jgi:ubiquinone/menaquinone biosynthesis C-methylase UbiE